MLAWLLAGAIAAALAATALALSCRGAGAGAVCAGARCGMPAMVGSASPSRAPAPQLAAGAGGAVPRRADRRPDRPRDAVARAAVRCRDGAWRRGCAWRRDPAWTLLACLTLIPSAVFLEHALGDRVQANWPGLIYPGRRHRRGWTDRPMAPAGLAVGGTGAGDDGAGLGAVRRGAVPVADAGRSDAAAARRLGHAGAAGGGGASFPPAPASSSRTITVWRPNLRCCCRHGSR